MIVLSKLAPQYRIIMDECYYHEPPEVRKELRWMSERIQCPNEGFIALTDKTPPILFLYTKQVKKARAIVKRVSAMPGLDNEWLDGEAVIFFPLEFQEVVAKMAGALRKRQGRKLSAGERAKLVEAGRTHRFTNKSTGHQVENSA